MEENGNGTLKQPYNHTTIQITTIYKMIIVVTKKGENSFLYSLKMSFAQAADLFVGYP